MAMSAPQLRAGLPEPPPPDLDIYLDAAARCLARHGVGRTSVQDVARELGVSPQRVCLAWMLAKPAVASPIIGATRMSHLDDAIASVGLELDADEVARLEGPYQPHRVAGHM